MNILRMAWRNLWRNRRRTLITISAMTMALLVEVLYSGLITGMLKGMQEDVVELELGDIQVQTPAYLERPSLYEYIPDSDELLRHVRDLGYIAAPRLQGGGLAASGDQSSGVVLRGLDIEQESLATRIHEHVMPGGSWLSSEDERGVVLGYRLSRSLSADIGDEVVVLSQGADGSMANDLFHVRGILSSVAGGTDRAALFMLEQAFRDLMVLPEGAHQVVVRIPDDVSLEDAKARIQEFQGGEGSSDIKVMTWREVQPVIGQMLDSASAMVGIMYVAIYLAVGILILNAMLMVVFERIREFGILKAIGAGPSRVFALIMVESLLQAFMALGAGLLLALPGMWYISERGLDVGSLGGVDMMGVAMRPVWKGVYTLESVQLPIILLFVVVITAVLYPALKAAWIQPVQAMRQR